MRAQGTSTAPQSDHTTPRLVSTLTVLERDGSAERSLLVACPMVEKTVQVDRCVACPKCARLDASEGSVGRPSVACSFETTGPSREPRIVAATLARFAVCMRTDAVGGGRPAMPGSMLPVVDAQGRLVGIAGPGARVRRDRAALDLAVDERTLLPSAIAHMARHHVRQVPVVDRDGVVVGILDDLDALRALRGVEPDRR